jgi:hypothetical protein
VASALNFKRFQLVPPSSINFIAAQENQEFFGHGSTIALGGQSITNTIFHGATITGNDDGSNATLPEFHDCFMSGNSLGAHTLHGCVITGNMTFAEAGNYYWDQCYSGVAGNATPTIDFGNAVAATNFNNRHYSGGVELKQFSDAGPDTMSLEGFGQLILNADCTAAGTITIRGNFTINDQVAGGWEAGGGTLTDDARIDTGQINAECDTALSDINLDHLCVTACGAAPLISYDAPNESLEAIAAGGGGGGATLAKQNEILDNQTGGAGGVAPNDWDNELHNQKRIHDRTGGRL